MSRRAATVQGEGGLAAGGKNVRAHYDAVLASGDLKISLGPMPPQGSLAPEAAELCSCDVPGRGEGFCLEIVLARRDGAFAGADLQQLTLLRLRMANRST